MVLNSWAEVVQENFGGLPLRRRAESVKETDVIIDGKDRMAKGSRKICKYKPTAKNRNTYRRWKRGESIGFTATASLKAKGMIPRSSKANRGKKIISAKYC